MGKETNIQVQEIERFPPKINKNCSKTRHLIVKLANSKDNEKILKAARDMESLTYMRRNIELTAKLSTETWQARRGWQDMFRVLNEKTCSQEYFIQQALIQNKRDKELPR